MITKSKIKISKHAIEKYLDIVKSRIEDPEREIRVLFNASKKEILNPGLLIRIMKNEFEETSFFKNKKWRFVICDDTMVTLEIDTFANKTGGYIKKKSLYNDRRKRK